MPAPLDSRVAKLETWMLAMKIIGIPSVTITLALAGFLYRAERHIAKLEMDANAVQQIYDKIDAKKDAAATAISVQQGIVIQKVKDSSSSAVANAIATQLKIPIQDINAQIDRLMGDGKTSSPMFENPKGQANRGAVCTQGQYVAGISIGFSGNCHGQCDGDGAMPYFFTLTCKSIRSNLQ